MTQQRFNTEKFAKTDGAVWNMDYTTERLIVPIREGFDALVGYRDSTTKTWLWIRKDFQK